MFFVTFQFEQKNMFETSSFEADKSANEYNKKISDLEWSQSKHQQRPEISIYKIIPKFKMYCIENIIILQIVKR